MPYKLIKTRGDLVRKHTVAILKDLDRLKTHPYYVGLIQYIGDQPAPSLSHPDHFFETLYEAKAVFPTINTGKRWYANY